jgi:hypothetical protein
MQQAARDLEPPFHGAGKRTDRRRSPVEQVDHAQHLFAPCSKDILRNVVQHGMKLQVFGCSQSDVERRILEHEADALPDLI